MPGLGSDWGPAQAAPQAAAGALGSDWGGAADTITSSNSQLQSTSMANARLLGDIAMSGNGAALAAGQAAATHNAGGGWLNDFFKVIDTPRAAIVSGVDTLANGGGFKDWLKGTEGHMTFGHVLNDLGVHSHLADSLGGMAGDIVLDPLSYVGGAGEIAKAAGLVGKVSDAVTAVRAADRASQALESAKMIGTSAEDLAPLHEAATAARTEAVTKAGPQAADGSHIITSATQERLAQKGLAGLTPEEKSFLGVDTGVKLRVPGSKLLGKEVGAKLVPGSVTEPFTGLVKGISNRIAENKSVQGLEKALVPLGAMKQQMRAAALAGDGNRAAVLHTIIKLVPEIGGYARTQRTELGNDLAKALDKAGPGNEQHVLAALEGDQGALKAIQDGGGNVGDLQDWLNKAHARADALGIPLGYLQNYVPHQLTEAGRQIVAKHGKGAVAGRMFAQAVMEHSRQLGPDAMFLGHKLETGSIDEINGIARDVLGKDALDVFNANPREVLYNYLHTLSRRMGEQHFANKLGDLGVTESGDMALTPEEAQALSQELARESGKSNRLGKMANRKESAYGSFAQNIENGFAPQEGGGAVGDLGGMRGPRIIQNVIDHLVANGQLDPMNLAAQGHYAPNPAQDLTENWNDPALWDGEIDPHQMLQEAYNATEPAAEAGRANAPDVFNAKVEPQRATKNFTERTPLKEGVGKTDLKYGPSGDQLASGARQLQETMRQLAEEHGWNADYLKDTSQAASDIAARSDLVKLGEKGAFAGAKAPQYVKDALSKLAEVSGDPKAAHGFLGWYDKALNAWKAYSLAMPGKAMRHTLVGPAWGAFLGNVDLKSLRDGFKEWRSYQKALKDTGGDVEKALGQLPNDVAERIRASTAQGIYHGHDFDVARFLGPKTRTGKVNAAVHNPLSTKSTYFRVNAEAQRRGQDYWRYATFKHAMGNGARAEDAAQRVRYLLGDPHGITNIERSTVRRFVPFYTFLRQNAPVEIKAMMTEPGKFVNAVETPEQETGQWGPQGGIVPQLFEQTGAVGLPWKIGGNQVFVSPDLPFSRFSEMASGWNQVESQLSPLIQALLERANNTNTFTGNPFSPYAKPMPAAELPSILGPLLSHLPGNLGVNQTVKASTDYGKTTPAGTWEITPRLQTILGNLFPMLTQAENLYTAGNPNTSARGDTSWLDAFLGGATFRTNDPAQQQGELLRRQAILKQITAQLQNSGELPAYIRASKNIGS